MLTDAATRSRRIATGVWMPEDLIRFGVTTDELRAHLAALRWRRYGRVIVTHAGPLSLSDRRGVALRNCGSRAILTAFTSLEILGLKGWERPKAHVLVPGGTRVRRVAAAPVQVHFTRRYDVLERDTHRRLHLAAPAVVRATATLAEWRPACGILAATVQQGLCTADAIRSAIENAPELRNRSLLLNATDDIAQGAQALSEIDFTRLCRRYRLPLPQRQAVRVEPSGRRRYLDAEWVRADGRRVVAEVDGALHLAVRRWWDDQFRQNELVIGGDLVLRFPSVIVRGDDALVADQLRRCLQI